MKKIFLSIATLGILLGLASCNTEHTHNIVTFEAKEPTCTELGYKAYEACTECDYTTFVKIEASGHDLEHCELDEATCTEDGKEEYWYCIECETKFYDAEGTYIITDEELIIKALGHSLFHYEYQEESCMEDGLKEHWYCDECDTYFSDAEGTNIISYENLIIAKKEHLDENADFICDYECGEAVITKEKLQNLIETTMSSNKVTVIERYIPGARSTSYYFDDNLLYINVGEGDEEKYYYTEESTTYLFTKPDEWVKETTTEAVNYNISYIFDNKFDLEISSEISVEDCGYGFFDGETMFEFTNSLGTNVEVKINAEGTQLDGIYICDKYNNIIYMFEMIYGEDEEVLNAFETIKNGY